ncbi:hypothetical protein [Methylobacterium sp. Leaf118]|uniref:hypothetical protein n=1 Tax=Methylobacterium sp. Leaf118 TaxID=2876562 RepID=UPI001E3547B8|nr:hypothetical protein [Methylobacterium sp. Leaf118]
MYSWNDPSTAPHNEEVIIQTRYGMYIAQWFSLRSHVSEHRGWYVHDGHQWHVIHDEEIECWMPLPDRRQKLTTSETGASDQPERSAGLGPNR